jgi:hypothetical protein
VWSTLRIFKGQKGEALREQSIVVDEPLCRQYGATKYDRAPHFPLGMHHRNDSGARKAQVFYHAALSRRPAPLVAIENRPTNMCEICMSIAPCDSTEGIAERQKPPARRVSGADDFAAQHFCGFREYQGIYGRF